MKTTITILTVALAMVTGSVCGSTIEVLEGDMDNYHGGDSADTPSFMSDTVTTHLAGAIGVIKNFDQYFHNNHIGWTYLFEIPEGETITSASIEIRTIGTAPVSVETDFISFDGSDYFSDAGYYRKAWLVDYGFKGDDMVMTFDLGSLTTKDTDTSEPYTVNILPELADGALDVIFEDDNKIDYALLRIETIPEPSFTVIMLGLLGVFWFKRIK